MSGLSLSQFKHIIVAPALSHVGLGGDAVVNLLTGTALVESGLVDIVQVTKGGFGPAQGLWQMEPFTHDDIWRTFLSDSQLNGLRQRILTIRADWPPGAVQMRGNVFYACVMARLKYDRVRTELPDAADASAQCRYWKTYYNTSSGAGVTDSRHVALFQQAIDA
ncbi:hypothetical protein JCM25156A_25780 [Komagataeibacter kakiaceti JCM 25156]